jgi:hypothetical protein
LEQSQQEYSSLADKESAKLNPCFANAGRGLIAVLEKHNRATQGISGHAENASGAMGVPMRLAAKELMIRTRQSV